jgi:hypothetical protein
MGAKKRMANLVSRNEGASRPDAERPLNRPASSREASEQATAEKVDQLATERLQAQRLIELMRRDSGRCCSEMPPYVVDLAAQI